MSAGNLYWSIIEPIWLSVSIYDGPEVFLDQFSRLSSVQQALLASHWCQSEVCNGGFHQFFWNSTGVLAPEAAAGFRAICLPACADLVDEAMQFFSTPYPRRQETRVAALDALRGSTRKEWDPFYTLDERFYAAIADDGFERAADAWVKS